MENSVKCPKCGSNQITAQKKGYDVKKAAAGAILVGGIGLVAGAIGSSDINITCLSCGNAWSPKKLNEERKKVERAAAAVVVRDVNSWKKAWISEYKKGNLELATAIFMKKRSFDARTPNIQAAFDINLKNERETKKVAYTVVLIIFIVIAIVYMWY